MSSTAHTHLHDSSGPVHSGSGDQHIHQYFQSLVGEGRRTSRRGMAEDQLRWLWRRFIAPSGLDIVRDLLSVTGTALIEGPAGSGRTTAARVTLYETRDVTGTYHELLPGDDPGDFPDPGLVGDGDRMLLDLSAADESMWHRVRRELSSFRATVVERRARLVVVLPTARQDDTLGELEQFRATITRPTAQEVLLSHLRAEGVTPGPVDRDDATLVSFFESEPSMRELADLAVLIVRARSNDQEHQGFSRWCRDALDAMTGREAQVKEKMSELDGLQRIFLLSAAMLHEAHADAVHDGAASLLRAVEAPRDTRPLLEQPDLSARLGKISATRDQQGRVHFDKLRYDAAVRTHLWDYVPDLRAPLRHWVSDQIRDHHHPTFSEPDRERLVTRLTAEHLRTGHLQELTLLTEAWTEEPRTSPRLRAAAQILRLGLESERHGRFFRRQIYDWSRTPKNEGLVRVLVDVCAEVIAVSHPDQALVRLHHLTRQQAGGHLAHESLAALMEADRRMRRRMLDRLARNSDESAWQDADYTLFHEVAAPLPLTDRGDRPRSLLSETTGQKQLIACWSRVLATRPHKEWRVPVRVWLHFAATHETHQNGLLDVLVTAAQGRGDLLSALYTTARDSERSTPGGSGQGAKLTNLLLSKISAAQGIPPFADPHSPSPGRSTA